MGKLLLLATGGLEVLPLAAHATAHGPPIIGAEKL